ncbi:hypothetical protein CL619_03240 [archaeon]|nr:hypothetical protein [archaeon]|tara:strand:- start:1538 stop:2002 length:465 start_codon:yes stop_codon:yes gene_type:complete
MVNDVDLLVKISGIICTSSIYDSKTDLFNVRRIGSGQRSSVSIDYCCRRMSDLNITVPEEREKMLESAGNGDLPYTGFTITMDPNSLIVSGQLNVHLNYRGEGYGRELIELAERVVRTMGMDEVRIESPNEGFFAYFGCEIVDDGEVYAVKKFG